MSEIMKKFAFLFVAMALAMFVFVFAASAQDFQLPAIDEAEAEAYLGDWSISQMCFGEDCMDLAGLGMISTLTFNTDNTIVMESEEGTDVLSWYMEDGTAYMVEPAENDQYQTTALTLTEDGNLVMGTEEVSIVYTRGIEPAAEPAALVEDAAFEDFAGEWFISNLILSGDTLPASLLAMTGSLNIKESTLNIDLMGETEEDVPFIIEDGALYFTLTDKDEAGNTKETVMILEYYDDNTVVLAELKDEGADEEFKMIFAREADVSEGPSFMDMLSLDGLTEGGEGAEMSEAELEALFAQLGDVNPEGEGSEEFDLGSLFQNFDFEGFMQDENVQGLLQDPEIQGLLENMSDENGQFSLDSIVSGLSGLFGSSEAGTGN